MKNRWTRALVALVVLSLLALPCGAAPGSPAPLTLDQAVAEARSANLTVRAEALKAGVKERDKNLAFNKFFPTLSVGAALSTLNDTYTYKQLSFYSTAPASFFPGYTAGPSPLANNYYFTPDATNLVLQMNGQFVLSWTIFEAIRQTGVDYDNAKISYQMAVQRLERDVRKMFFQLLVLQEAIRVTEHQVAAAAERYQQALTNQKAGQSARLTVLQAKVAYENKKPGLEDLKVNYQQLLFGFEALLGRSPDPTVELQGSLDLDLPPARLDAERAVAQFLGRRLDVQAARGQLRAAEGLLGVQTSQWLPAVGVQFSADPFVNNPSSRSWEYLTEGTNWHQKSGSWTLFATWKLDTLLPFSPFFNQHDNLADLGAQAQLGVDGAALAGRAEVMGLFRKIEKSTLALASLAANADSAREAHDLTEVAYQSGVRSLLEVQDSDVQYQFAQLALLNEKQLLNASLLDLETALNTPRAEIFALTLPEGAPSHEN